MIVVFFNRVYQSNSCIQHMLYETFTSYPSIKRKAISSYHPTGHKNKHPSRSLSFHPQDQPMHRFNMYREAFVRSSALATTKFNFFCPARAAVILQLSPSEHHLSQSNAAPQTGRHLLRYDGQIIAPIFAVLHYRSDGARGVVVLGQSQRSWQIRQLGIHRATHHRHVAVHYRSSSTDH